MGLLFNYRIIISIIRYNSIAWRSSLLISYSDNKFVKYAAASFDLTKRFGRFSVPHYTVFGDVRFGVGHVPSTSLNRAKLLNLCRKRSKHTYLCLELYCDADKLYFTVT